MYNCVDSTNDVLTEFDVIRETMRFLKPKPILFLNRQIRKSSNNDVNDVRHTLSCVKTSRCMV